MAKKRRVTFMTGRKTKTKKDDALVDFFAAPKGALDGIQVEGLGMGTKKTREISGFDNAFGLGGFDFGKGLNPELSRPFASSETKVSQTEMGFGRSFFQDEQEFIENDPVVPEAISENFDEPNEQSLFDTGETEDKIPVDFGVPDLFSTIQNVSLGKRIAKTDDELSRPQKLELKFNKARMQALETGGNPLSPQEELAFEGIKASGTFGTGARRPIGFGGRF